MPVANRPAEPAGAVEPSSVETRAATYLTVRAAVADTALSPARIWAAPPRVAAPVNAPEVIVPRPGSLIDQPIVDDRSSVCPSEKWPVAVNCCVAAAPPPVVVSDADAGVMSIDISVPPLPPLPPSGWLPARCPGPQPTTPTVRAMTMNVRIINEVLT